MSNNIQEFCYEYFDCKEFDCVRRTNPDLNCWEVDLVSCKSHSPEFEKLKEKLGSKQEACKFCIYYQRHHL